MERLPDEWIWGGLPGRGCVGMAAAAMRKGRRMGWCGDGRGDGKYKAATVFRGGNFFVRANDLSFRLNSGMMDHLDGFHFSRDCPWQILGFFRIAGS